MKYMRIFFPINEKLSVTCWKYYPKVAMKMLPTICDWCIVWYTLDSDTRYCNPIFRRNERKGLVPITPNHLYIVTGIHTSQSSQKKKTQIRCAFNNNHPTPLMKPSYNNPDTLPTNQICIFTTLFSRYLSSRISWESHLRTFWKNKCCHLPATSGQHMHR